MIDIQEAAVNGHSLLQFSPDCKITSVRTARVRCGSGRHNRRESAFASGTYNDEIT